MRPARNIGLVAVVAAGSALSAYLAWRRTTSMLYHRSANSTIRPQHVRSEDYDEWVIARRKRWRPAKAVVAGFLGAAIAGLLFTMVGSGLARR